MVKVIGVRFRRAGKVYYFTPGNHKMKQGDAVIVETVRGVEYGKVVMGPKEVKEEEIIAFYSSLEDSGIITHRVTENNVVSGIFRTKGDANEQGDPLPVPYDNYIGSVRWILPGMGAFLTGMTSVNGKIAAACVVMFGVLLNLLGSWGKGRRQTDLF